MHPVSLRQKALRLLEDGWSINAVGKHLRVSRSAVRDWRDNGVQPRRPGSAECFVCAGTAMPSAIGYAALLGYYLGDGCVSRTRRTYSLRVSCDESYPGIVADVTDAVTAVHSGGRVCHVRAPGVVVVQNCWNHWPCVFPQYGPGRKHERPITLAEWQVAVVRSQPAALLRGLFHSDGSRTRNWVTRVVSGENKRYDYPRWQFVNNSADIRGFCTDALDLLDIPWRQSNWKTVSVSTREGVAMLDELVGLKS